MGRHHSNSNRRSVLTLFCGISIGFTFAVLFHFIPNQTLWQAKIMFHGNDNEFHDPHSGDDLSNAVGPINDVG